MDSTGSRDVCLAARVRNIRSVEAFDQSGLYIGSSRTTACRAGGLSTVLFNSARTLFSTNTIDGIGPGTAHVAGPPDGSDLFVTIGRLGGQFLFDANGTERVLGPQPAHLNGVAALNVELFAANPGNTPGEVSTIDRFAAYVNSRVVPELGTFLLLLPGLLLLAAVGVQQRAPAGVRSRTALSEAAA
ncbi:MAG: hypothetical protein MUE41_02030 [Gemmatimonadaceae bacterium]|nr:hypothetical protein [Gemmatimonadaceae bacterium]